MATTQSLSVTEVANSQDIANNTSKVRILWTSTQTGGSHNTNTRTAYYYVSVNGGTETTHSVTYTLPYTSTVVMVDTTITVTHNSSGGGSVRVRTWCDTRLDAGVIEKENTLNLSTISRYATITSAPNFTDLDNLTVGYKNPLGNSVTSLSLEITFSDFNEKVSRTLPKTGTSCVFEFTEAEKSVLRRACVGLQKRPVILKLTTVYSGKTFNDTKQVTMTIAESDDVKPELTMTIAPNNSNLGSQFDGLYIQNKSKIDVSLSAEFKYLTSARSYTTTVNSKSYTGQAFTTDVLTASGETVVTAKVVDKRYYTGEDSETINVIPYTKPYVTNASGYPGVMCYRSDEFGVAANDGTYVYVRVKRGYSPVIASDGLQKNFCKLRWRKKSPEAEWQDNWEDLISEDDISTDEYKGALPGIFLKSSEYSIQIGVIDELGEHDEIPFSIPTEAVLLHLSEEEDAVGILGYADISRGKNATVYENFYADKDIYVGNGLYIKKHPVADFVLEQGATDGWIYRKWSSGFIEQWKKLTVSASTWETWANNSMVYFRETVSLPFATEVNLPQIQLTNTNNSWCIPLANNVQYDSFELIGLRHSGINGNYLISIYVCGI